MSWLQHKLHSHKSHTARLAAFRYHMFSSLASLLLAAGILSLLFYLFSSCLQSVAIALWHWADGLLLLLDSGYHTPI